MRWRSRGSWGRTSYIGHLDEFGCPMFAPAYVGRKTWARPFDRSCSANRSTGARSPLKPTEGLNGAPGLS